VTVERSQQPARRLPAEASRALWRGRHGATSDGSALTGDSRNACAPSRAKLDQQPSPHC